MQTRAKREATEDEKDAANGDCYEAAFLSAMEMADNGYEPLVTHATVTGQGPIEGVRFGHAWVEIPDMGLAFDTSNGRNIVMPIDRYREIGEAGDIRQYTREEIRDHVLAAGHYGPDWTVKARGRRRRKAAKNG